jgi:hypothetical protein
MRWPSGSAKKANVPAEQAVIVTLVSSHVTSAAHRAAHACAVARAEHRWSELLYPRGRASGVAARLPRRG